MCVESDKKPPEQLACRVISFPDGGVGQLLLLAHHRGSGGHPEASGFRGHADHRPSGRKPFRGDGRDGRRDRAVFQPSRKAAVRTGASEELQKHTREEMTMWEQVWRKAKSSVSSVPVRLRGVAEISVQV